MLPLRILIPVTVVPAAVACFVACSKPEDTSSRTRADKQVVEPGNATCPAGTTEVKIEPVENGTFPLDGGSVTLSNVDGTTFDFTSTVGIDFVIVKGGPDSNVYSFSEATSGTGLHAPDNPQSGGFYGLSHVSFCFDADEDAGVDAGEEAGDDAGADAGEEAGEEAGVDAGEDAGVPADDAGVPADDAGGGGKTW